MNKGICLIFISIIVTSSLRAQQTIDSLQAILSSSIHDSTRVNTLLAVAGELLFDDPDSAFYYCRQARAVAIHLGRHKELAQAEGWWAYLQEQRGHISEAILHYEHSLKHAEAIGDKDDIATVLNNLAAINKDLGSFDRAMYYHERSLALRKAMNDSVAIATSLNNIGYLLYDLGRLKEALDNYSNALHLYEQVDDQDGISTALHNIAILHKDQGDFDAALGYLLRVKEIQEKSKDWYSLATTEDNIGNVLEMDDDQSGALQHYYRALELHRRSRDPRGMGYSLRNIAGIDLKRNLLDSAFQHAQEAYAYFESTEDKRGEAASLLTQAQALMLLGKSALAEQKALIAMSLSKELGHAMLTRDVAQLLAQMYRSDQRWKQALDMEDLYHLMQDSVQSQEIQRNAIKQQYSYEYEKKEALIKAEQLKKDVLTNERIRRETFRRNGLLLVGSGFLLLAIGLWSRLRLMRRSKAEIQKEKEISEELLHNILPKEVATELRSKGHAEAKHFDQATVLFTDFKRFTLLSEQLSAADLVAEIDICFKAFDHIVEKYRVEKIKTIGDSYMAAGGLPDPKFGSPSDVILAALEMQQFMTAHLEKRESEGLITFEMRLGIHTGPVVAGIVGVKKFQYDIWGDTVNTASRMESSGEVGRVNISESTYRSVNSDARFKFIPRGKIEAKGKGEIEMWFVESADA